MSIVNPTLIYLSRVASAKAVSSALQMSGASDFRSRINIVTLLSLLLLHTMRTKFLYLSAPIALVKSSLYLLYVKEMFNCFLNVLGSLSTLPRFVIILYLSIALPLYVPIIIVCYLACQFSVIIRCCRIRKCMNSLRNAGIMDMLP